MLDSLPMAMNLVRAQSRFYRDQHEEQINPDQKIPIALEMLKEYISEPLYKQLFNLYGSTISKQAESSLSDLVVDANYGTIGEQKRRAIQQKTPVTTPKKRQLKSDKIDPSKYKKIDSFFSKKTTQKE